LGVKIKKILEKTSKIISMNSGVLRVAHGGCGAKAPPLATRPTTPDCRCAKLRVSACYFGPAPAFMVILAPAAI